jgi:hypothetical protein
VSFTIQKSQNMMESDSKAVVPSPAKKRKLVSVNPLDLFPGDQSEVMSLVRSVFSQGRWFHDGGNLPRELGSLVVTFQADKFPNAVDWSCVPAEVSVVPPDGDDGSSPADGFPKGRCVFDVSSLDHLRVEDSGHPYAVLEPVAGPLQIRVVSHGEKEFHLSLHPEAPVVVD